MPIKIKRNTMITLFYLSASILTVGVLISAIVSMHSLSLDNYARFDLFYGLTFLFLSLSRLPIAFNAIKREPNKIVMIKNFVFSGVYLIIAILTFIFEYNFVFSSYASGIFFLVIGANRVCRIFEKRKPIFMIINVILAAISFTLGLGFILDSQNFLAFSTLAIIVIIFVSLIDTLAFALSRIQLKGILRILKETYSFEIIYGLILLIIAFSVYFYAFEPGIETYGDALWLSFSIVTTIGFGDVVITAVFSRVLAVILGIYGLIVVAVFTSVIVNYYNEVREKRQLKSQQEQSRKLEEQQKQIEELQEVIEGKKEPDPAEE